MTIEQIYHGAIIIINNLLREELLNQGHISSGQLSDSFENKILVDKQAAILEGYAIYYAKIVDEGLDTSEISFGMLPHLITYFKLKGLDEINAKKAAINTIKKWMKEGLPTEASKRFSKTGERTGFIQAALSNERVDEYMTSTFDLAINEEYKKTPNETI